VKKSLFDSLFSSESYVFGAAPRRYGFI